ncbi:MAG: DNA-directed RNA polymerase subunit alpha [Planctomycetes bacterium]|nr:DNA-directed RNA polymerase subunit alpha [Planctomycetota bacterium]
MAIRVKWRDLELPTRVVLEKETSTNEYGKFSIEPFERGFGTTIGNSLRRVLLSALEGTAITHVKIKGVRHEFSTVPGVYEDVTDIVLNLKKLLLKVHSDEPVHPHVETSKEGPIRGQDLVVDNNTEIVNPELHLCTVVEPGEFRMDLTARRGRGYVTAEENMEEEQELGVIPIDSIFSPVRRVRWKTEDTRVGKLTNYDKLVIEIWTDGTLHPEMALVEASKILRKHLNPFTQYFQVGREVQRNEAKREEAERRERQKEDLLRSLEMSVDTLDLSVRASNCLSAEGIKTIAELVQKSEDELLAIRNFGKTSLREIKKKIEDLGLSLGMDVAEFYDRQGA